MNIQKCPIAQRQAALQVNGVDNNAVPVQLTHQSDAAFESCTSSCAFVCGLVAELYAPGFVVNIRLIRSRLSGGHKSGSSYGDHVYGSLWR